jgi:hypothetical protein
MNSTFAVLTYILLFLSILYFVNYILILSSNCDNIPKADDDISKKECCEGTWTRFDGSVNLTLFIISIGLFVWYWLFFYIF